MAQASVRVWLVVLAVLGLVAGLLGGGGRQGAFGAHGDDPDVDFEAVYSACVGAATEGAGFEDTVGLNTEEQINCLGHYGITQGRTETTFAPRESVLRWQMALFMARAAVPAGIVLETPAEDQGFTDIGAVSEEARNAINGLAKMGIMPGTSQTLFSPNSAVTRGSMAIILDGFLKNATPGAGAFAQAVDSYDDVNADNFDVFTDVNSVSLLTYNAIYRIYEVGVTQGTGDHLYSPNDLVTRQQMAAFIMRTLAHTVARPAGVSVLLPRSEVDMGNGEWIIWDTEETKNPAVSVIGEGFERTAGLGIGWFVASGDEEDPCDSPAAGSCDIGLLQTYDNGSNDEISISVADLEDGSVVRFFTGDEGSKWTENTPATELIVSLRPGAETLVVEADLGRDGARRVNYGSDASVTLTVADAAGDPVDYSGLPDNIPNLPAIAANYAEDHSGNTRSGSVTLNIVRDGDIARASYEQGVWEDPETEAGTTSTVTLTITEPADLDLAQSGGEELEEWPQVYADFEPGQSRIEEEAENADKAPGDGRVYRNSSGNGVVVLTWADRSDGYGLELATNNYCASGDRDWPCASASDEGDGATVRVELVITDDFGVALRRDLPSTNGERLADYEDEDVSLTRNSGSRASYSATRDNEDGRSEEFSFSLPTQTVTPAIPLGNCIDGENWDHDGDGEQASPTPEEECTETDDLSKVVVSETIRVFWAEALEDGDTTGDARIGHRSETAVLAYIDKVEEVEGVEYVAADDGIRGLCVDTDGGCAETDDVAPTEGVDEVEAVEAVAGGAWLVTGWGDEDQFHVGGDPATRADWEAALMEKSDDPDHEYRYEWIMVEDNKGRVDVFTLS